MNYLRQLIDKAQEMIDKAQAQWVEVVMIVLVVIFCVGVLYSAFSSPQQLVVVDTNALTREYTLQLAQSARDGKLDDKVLNQAATQWLDDLLTLLEQIADDNDVVIVPVAIGAPNWTDKIRARLAPPVIEAQGDNP